MSGWSPPELSGGTKGAVAAFYSVVVVYSLLVLQELLLAVVIGALLAVVYVLWRMLAALEAVADAVQRMAADEADVTLE